MTKYLAIFHGPASDDDIEEFTQEQQQEFMKAWSKWAHDNKDAIVDYGTPLGQTKRVTQDKISAIKNDLVTYTLVQAESHDDAAKIFLSHPHTTLFPGTSIDVMECRPVPKDLF